MHKVCATSGCRKLVPVGRRCCDSHERQRTTAERARDDAARADDLARVLYRSGWWRRRALAQLRAEPLCARCLSLGRTVAAEVADHVEPHWGDETAFRTGPLQSLCHPCHNGWKRAAEARWRARPSETTRKALRAGG